MTRAYEYRHIVGFEETNLVGNVYYTNHVSWQGRVREMFLRDHAPSVLVELQRGLALVTTHCSCDYYNELIAFDQITIRMTLREMTQSRLTLDFEDPEGQRLALVDDGGKGEAHPWAKSPVPAEHQIRGLGPIL
jgi:enediyne biosynthesis thioesterase